MKRIIAAMLTMVLFAGLLAGCAKSKKAQNNPSKSESVVNPFKNASVGDIVKFGSYEQDNDTSNGKEDIEWLVLAKEENRILIISRYALDCKPYNTTRTDVTWETCSLRTWLNESFINNAFNSDEQKLISATTVTADENPDYSTSLGNNTSDKVFLLSITEVNKYFKSDEARKCTPTDYTIAQGAMTDEAYDPVTCFWWLRSPGQSSDYAAYVSSGGDVDAFGGNVDDSEYAVRPAMWVSLD